MNALNFGVKRSTEGQLLVNCQGHVGITDAGKALYVIQYSTLHSQGSVCSSDF